MSSGSSFRPLASQQTGRADFDELSRLSPDPALLPVSEMIARLLALAAEALPLPRKLLPAWHLFFFGVPDRTVGRQGQCPVSGLSVPKANSSTGSGWMSAPSLGIVDTRFFHGNRLWPELKFKSFSFMNFRR